MLGNTVQCYDDNKKIEGCVTNIIAHDDGNRSYEILANGKIFYKSSEEISQIKQANQENILIKSDDSIVVNQLKKLSQATTNVVLQNDINKLVKNYERIF